MITSQSAQYTKFIPTTGDKLDVRPSTLPRARPFGTLNHDFSAYRSK